MLSGLAACAPTVTPAATHMPPGFNAGRVHTGLTRPTALRFDTRGRAWIAEQAGRIKVFNRLGDTVPALSADITADVFGRNNRGLLGLAPDPADESAAFVLYTFPAPPEQSEPTWNDDATNCPDGTTRSCVSTGVLSRLVFGTDGVAVQTKLVRGWCHHHASHAPGDLQFGPDGALYASSGEGSVPELDFDDGTWIAADLRCNAGALSARATPSERAPGEWVGAITRFQPADLALVAEGRESGDWLAERATVVAYGLRNPFRMAFRPSTTELWIGDPGGTVAEEINVVTDATDLLTDDFGWPCREGFDALPAYADYPQCVALAEGSLSPIQPWLSDAHGAPVVDDGGACGPAPYSISAVAHTPADWPDAYAGALVYGDYSRGCAFLARADTDGRPSAETVELFWSEAGAIVDLTAGPDGALYATDFQTGTITRLAWSGP